MPLKSWGILQELLVTFSCLRRGNPIKRFSIKTPRSWKANERKWKNVSPVRSVGQGAPAGALPVGQRKSQVLPFTGGIVAPAELNEDTVTRHWKQCVYSVQNYQYILNSALYLHCTIPQNRARPASHSRWSSRSHAHLWPPPWRQKCPWNIHWPPVLSYLTWEFWCGRSDTGWRRLSSQRKLWQQNYFRTWMGFPPIVRERRNMQYMSSSLRWSFLWIDRNLIVCSPPKCGFDVHIPAICLGQQNTRLEDADPCAYFLPGKLASPSILQKNLTLGCRM